MGKSKQKKCKNCGRMFVAKEKGEVYCSTLCKATGCFVGGGGDTSKPLNYEQRRLLEKRGGDEQKPMAGSPKKVGGEKFPRVLKMFSLPSEERWELAKTFTEEERKYAQRVAKRMLIEEKKMAMDVEWEGETPGEGVWQGGFGGDVSVGDSDDGTV